MQYIISQDRDTMVNKGPLHTLPQVVDGVLYGINLYCGETFLGTFDTAEGAINEMARIDASEDDYILVDGCSDFMEDDGQMWILDEIDIRDLEPGELFDLITEALND